MDFCRNVAVSGDQYQQDQVLSPSSIPPSSSANLALADPLDGLFPAHTTEVDVSLEWLSIFVEDCLSSSGICLPASELPTKNNAATATAAPTPKPLQQQQQQTSTTTTPTPLPSLEKFVVPGRARSKRKRAPSTAAVTTTKLTQTSRSLSSLKTSCWTTTHDNNPADTQLFHSDDPPLLQVQQAFWLADSQLIFPKKETTNTNTINTNSNKKAKANDGDDEEAEDGKEEDTDIGKEVEVVQQQQQQGRRCSHCLSQRTPQWRAGPLGPKTLCNACGVRYKSGRLLPEYRPAKSPTFVSYLHSNSHKKVLEMRMALMPSPSSLPK